MPSGDHARRGEPAGGLVFRRRGRGFGADSRGRTGVRGMRNHVDDLGTGGRTARGQLLRLRDLDDLRAAGCARGAADPRAPRVTVGTRPGVPLRWVRGTASSAVPPVRRPAHLHDRRERRAHRRVLVLRESIYSSPAARLALRLGRTKPGSTVRFSRPAALRPQARGMAPERRLARPAAVRRGVGRVSTPRPPPGRPGVRGRRSTASTPAAGRRLSAAVRP
jgi:hypothetical protein